MENDNPRGLSFLGEKVESREIDDTLRNESLVITFELEGSAGEHAVTGVYII